MEIKETLEKQLRLLSEQSETATKDELCDLTGAMCQVVKMLHAIESREAAMAHDAAVLTRVHESWCERQQQKKEERQDTQSNGIVEKARRFF